MLNLLLHLVLLFSEAPHGLRYLRVGGRGFCLGAGKTRSQKMLENAAESPASSAPRKSGSHFSRQKPSSGMGESILSKDRTISRTKQWRHAEEASPKCTMVTGPIDLYTGGEGGKDPDEEANPRK